MGSQIDQLRLNQFKVEPKPKAVPQPKKTLDIAEFPWYYVNVSRTNVQI